MPRRRTLPDDPPRHWHIWQVCTETRTAAWMSKAYTSRSRANKIAAREGGREWRMVTECHHGRNCPRPPKTEET